MTEIENFISNKKDQTSDSRPVILDLSQKKDRDRLAELINKNEIKHISNHFETQLEEYFQIENPDKVYTKEFSELLKNYLQGKQNELPLWQQGRWIFYPWHSYLVHTLPEEEFVRVRTARNKYLINDDEQERFYDSTIGLAGLSVGNSVALAIVLQGGGKRWKIADHDILELTNTNRIRTSIEYIGVSKAEMTMRQMYEINPYLEIELFKDGLTLENIDAFFVGQNKLDIVIDEIDNLAVKYLIREQAKKNKLAVVMAADNGDNGVVDIERYDENPDIPFFHGRMGDVNYDMLKSLDKFGIGKMITRHIGPENLTEKTQKSLLEMGKTIVSWPQLGGAALLNGSAVAYCVRKILNKQPLEQARALISLDEKLIPNYDSFENKTQREKIAQEFRNIFGL